MLEFEATTSRHRIEIGLVTAGPGPERDLVERRIERHGVGFILDQLRHRRCVAGEAFDELRTPDVYIVRPAIVAKVPDHLGALAMGGLQHRQEARPIVLARRPFDQVPAQAVAHAVQAVPVQHRVIMRRPAIMAGGCEQIETPAIAAAMVRAFETTHEETLERKSTRLNSSHVKISYAVFYL